MGSHPGSRAGAGGRPAGRHDRRDKSLTSPDRLLSHDVMAFHASTGATLQCSFGVAPSTLVVLPVQRMLDTSLPAANISDSLPIVNIPPFGACTSTSNPTVAAATAAALGVLTPMPCVPVTTTPWTPGSSTVLESGMPALDNTCKLQCMWGGIIQILSPGQTTVMVG